jgi:hypothetical protein
MPYVLALVSKMPPRDIGAGHVALTDIGCDFYGLVLLYCAMSLINSVAEDKDAIATGLKGYAGGQGVLAHAKHVTNSIFKAYTTEPQNLATVIGLIIALLGPTPTSEQHMFGVAVERLAACCGPCIYIYLGIRMTLNIQQDKPLFFLLLCRSGFGMIFTGALSVVRSLPANEIMLWLFLTNASMTFAAYAFMVKFQHHEDARRADMARILIQKAADLAAEKSRAVLHAEVTKHAGTHGTKEKVFKDLEEVANAIEVAVQTGDSEFVEILTAIAELLQAEDTFDTSIALRLISLGFTWTAFSSTTYCAIPYETMVKPSFLFGLGGLMVGTGGCALAYLTRSRHLEHQAESNDTGAMTPNGTIVLERQASPEALEASRLTPRMHVKPDRSSVEVGENEFLAAFEDQAHQNFLKEFNCADYAEPASLPKRRKTGKGQLRSSSARK